VHDVVERAGSACGVRLRYEAGAGGDGAPVVVDGVRRGVVRALDPGDVGIVAARLAADATAELLGRLDRVVLAPMRTTSAALTQLLLCAPANVPVVAARARDAGLAVDGWHCAARIAAEGDGRGRGLPDLERDVLALVADRAGRGDRASWSVARPDDTVVLVRTSRRESRSEAPRLVAAWVTDLAESLRTTRPGLRLRVGVATTHEGANGVRVSAEESRTALAAARLGEDAVNVATFDGLGARRMLAEWLVTETAREAVRDLLAPLDALGPDKSLTAVRTLHAYLDERGSLQRAAARLHVHRNAVVYRIDGIKEALGLDLADPDIRFALQLACRGRLMVTGDQ
jgi:sugar diacid utilization regulator